MHGNSWIKLYTSKKYKCWIIDHHSDKLLQPISIWVCRYMRCGICIVLYSEHIIIPSNESSSRAILSISRDREMFYGASIAKCKMFIPIQRSLHNAHLLNSALNSGTMPPGSRLRGRGRREMTGCSDRIFSEALRCVDAWNDGNQREKTQLWMHNSLRYLRRSNANVKWAVRFHNDESFSRWRNVL